MIRFWLREMGFDSQIFAEHIHSSVEKEVRPLAAYRPGLRERYLIYHHSVGSHVADDVASRDQRVILIYHNVTPAEFFVNTNPEWAQMSHRGTQQLSLLRPKTALALADSPYNQQDLRAAGFVNIELLPIVLGVPDYELPINEALAAKWQTNGPILLFVGRFSPNKRQEDLVKLLYFYHRICPTAHLILVGDRWTIRYDKWVEAFAADLGLAERVTLTGKVTQQDLVTYYRIADLYLSMSEHEGFGKPLIESMSLSSQRFRATRRAGEYTVVRSPFAPAHHRGTAPKSATLLGTIGPSGLSGTVGRSEPGFTRGPRVV
jgi:glycosyltransferase involved in cell wall biosynthesis